MTEKLKKIRNLKEKLSSMRPLNEGELKRLHEEFTINNCYHSNAIEGSTLTLRETSLILQEGITIAQKPIKEHLEAIGHKDAFEYVTELVKADTVLSEGIIKNIHSLVLMADRENRGIYRRLPVIISGSMHTPPEPFLVPEMMEQLVEDYLRSDDDIINAVSILHLKFESIHPFIDGNGRTGRLLLNFELMKSGLLPVNIKFEDRMKYYDAFESYHERGKPDALAELVADYEVQELERYINIIEKS